MELISVQHVHCEVCFNPWQQVRDWRASSQLRLIDWPLIFGYEVSLMAEKRSCQGDWELPWRWAWAGDWQKDDWGPSLPETGRKKNCFPQLCMSLQNAPHFRCNMVLVALLRLFPLGLFFVPKAIGNGIQPNMLPKNNSRNNRCNHWCQIPSQPTQTDTKQCNVELLSHYKNSATEGDVMTV